MGSRLSRAAAGRRPVRQAPADAARVRAYLAALPVGARRRLKEVRAAVRGACPRAADAFSYGIPAFRLDGRVLVWYAAWSEHCSVYPVTAAVRRAADAKGLKSAKGTLRLPLAAPVPGALIRRLVRERAAALRARPS